LETWLGEREEVCVVGDPRQTIYSFAGASSSFLAGFRDRFPAAKVIELNRNYRSAPEIVTWANSALPETSLVAVRKSAGEVAVRLESDAKVVTLVAEEIATTKRLEEVAILARTNAQLEPFERALKSRGISCQVRGQGRFFSRPEVMQASSALRALSVSESQEPLFAQVSKIVTELGWSSKPSKDEKWLALQWFIDVLDELGNPSLDEYLRELAERERSGHEPTRDAVTLATVHGAKGLEYGAVYLVGMSEGSFPSPFAKSESELAEEQRLFFVAITRAKDRLRVFGSKSAPSSLLKLVGNRS
ncbi:MAG: ATP-dependent helicase, partial [Aquiluna sp.]